MRLDSSQENSNAFTKGTRKWHCFNRAIKREFGLSRTKQVLIHGDSWLFGLMAISNQPTENIDKMDAFQDILEVSSC
ncbi:MAG: hypothetical protein EAZ25_25320 [Oscillatoriales cyanobacterium]|nr:MAG: hypothetical protein EAZ25_25320 [Oscillatoriales cyanobacterium]